MNVDAYKQRVVDNVIKERLHSVGAIVIEGPKWCGKSTTGLYHSNSAIYLDDPSRRRQYELFAEQDPKLLLEGDTPRLLDEWEIIPSLWDAVRFTVDHHRGFGQFILTGSAKPTDRTKISHSGTGRFSWLRMRPMSLLESGDSSGEISIRKLFDGDNSPIMAEANADLHKIAFLCCRGGWPMATYLEGKYALNPAKDYFNAVVNVDINKVDNVNRSTERARQLMKSYARFQGTQTPMSQIVNDMNGNDVKVMDEKTARSYIDALESIFVIEEMPAWNPNLKSKTAIRTTPTRYFVDPSIATASLGCGPGGLIDDLKTFGYVFESLCARDLRVYAQALEGEVYHYRDKNGLECDAVIYLPDGNYALIEVKLGGEAKIEEGASNLINLASKIDTTKMKAPSFLMVLTAIGSLAYKRSDNVYVVPVTTLGI